MGIALTVFAVLTAVLLVMSGSLRQRWNDRAFPLTAMDTHWSAIQLEPVAIEVFLKQPLRDDRPIPFRSMKGTLLRMTTAEQGVFLSDIVICPDRRIFAPLNNGSPGASIAEWKDQSWQGLIQPGSEPAIGARGVVNEIFCGPQGRVLLADPRNFLDLDGRSIAARPTGLVVSGPGGFYNLRDVKNSFRLWFTRTPEDPWLPVGGASEVQGLSVGSAEVIAWGARVGRIVGLESSWRAWPVGFRPDHVRARANGGYFAWNGVTLLVAKTFEEEPRSMPMPGLVTDVLEGIDEPNVLWFISSTGAQRFRLK